jgi:exopolyphosphatase/guanosine-5'-triphosphate,3'-diphosphate pyrophosphatase
VRSFLAPAVADARMLTPFTAVGSSGTILNLARIAAASRGRDPLGVSGGDSFTVKEIRDAVAMVLERKSSHDRRDIEGLDERRQDIIAAGAVLLDEIVDLLAVDQLVVSDAALREGILVDRAVSHDQSGVGRQLGDFRRRSVMRMADTFHEDLRHIGRATELALQLFDGLQPVTGLSTADRNLLEAAGLLHNVGLFVSHAAHHRHSYYVIRNTDQLVGYTDREVELIAQIARYHRKSEPKPSHVEFQALIEADQRRVRLLAGMLRIGIALDRTRQGVVDHVTVRGDRGRNGSIDIDVHTAGAEFSLEQYTAEQRISLLESALGAPVRLHFGRLQ